MIPSGPAFNFVAAFVFSALVCAQVQAAETPAPSAVEAASPPSLVGIGAMLKAADGGAKVSLIVPGSPAQVDGRLKVGDRIMAVAAGVGEYVDVHGMPVAEVVRMIRGEKGTHVRLVVLPADAGEPSQRKEIELVRAEVDFSKAADLYQKAAADGDVTAQVQLGSLYKDGNGVAQDYKKAAEWYEKAAAQGSSEAQMLLGSLYAHGKGVAQDHKKAAELCEKAAAQGSSEAQVLLGSLYAHGEGVPQDYKKAAELYEKSAAQDNSNAQGELGSLYAQGKGVSQNYSKALELYEKASGKGNPLGYAGLASLYVQGKGVTQDYKKAIELYEKAAAQDNAYARGRLGLLYEQGKGVPQDYKKAAELYEKAAAQGSAMAQVFLARLCVEGKGVPQDYKKAANLYEKAAMQGDANAQTELGSLFREGKGVPQDYMKAAELYEKAAAQGGSAAQTELGWLYEEGKGVSQNYKKAAELYEKAAAAGNHWVQTKLGWLYTEGKGVSQNYKKAAELYQKAADQGDVTAQFNLACLYDGKRLPRDYKKAANLLQKAAAQNNADAQASLGSLYETGSGVEQNARKAAELYRQSAEQNNFRGQVLLSGLYARGVGVLQDYVEALKWLDLAAISGEAPIIEDRDALANRMTTQGVAKAQQLARRFLEEREKVSQAKVSRTRVPDTPTVSGTGFFISRDGYLLTNHHVVRGATKISVKVQDEELSASLVSADAGNDLAVLKVNGDFTPIPLGEARDVGLGDAVMTVGFPNIEVQGFSPKLTRGEISSLKGIQDDPRVFQISVPLQPGNSGGPLIDASGNAIGITTAQLDALIALKFSGSLPQNVNYALKVSYARLLVESVPHLSEKLPPPQKGKLEASAITDRAIHGTALILVWQKAENKEPGLPEEK